MTMFGPCKIDDAHYWVVKIDVVRDMGPGPMTQVLKVNMVPTTQNRVRAILIRAVLLQDMGGVGGCLGIFN